MANFWDLPRPVRDTIYRLHLVQDDPITEKMHNTLTVETAGYTGPRPVKRMSAVCQLSKKAEREAATIYYGENSFDFGRLKDETKSCVRMFAWQTYPRHLRLVRSITYAWAKTGSYHSDGGAREDFLAIGRMPGLQELRIRVDEESIVRNLLSPHRKLQRSPDRALGYQDNLAIMRYPGMTGLLTLYGIPNVVFIKAFDYYGVEKGGPLPGGLLETEIVGKLQAPKPAAAPRRRKGSFPFLSLPPELRNRIYGMLLTCSGPVHPSTEGPSSAAKSRKSGGSYGSALNLLAACKQIHDEAEGIFYHSNEFEFYYPSQLHAFVLSLSDTRLRSIRNITIEYWNTKNGGINLVDLSFPVLKQLTGLRQLHILFVQRGIVKLLQNYSWYSPPRWNVRKANLVKIPGMRLLFTLRGISDIKVRDTYLERELEQIKDKPEYPDRFGKDTKNDGYVKLTRVLAHFNAALAAAQIGRVNKELLEDDEWHLRDEFPTLEPEPEVVDDVGEESEEEADDMPDDGSTDEDAKEDGEAVGQAGDGGGDDMSDQDDEVGEDDDSHTAREPSVEL